MKRFLQIVFALSLVSIAACSLFKKDKSSKKPSDGVERPWSSKPLKTPETVKVCDGIEYTLLAKGDGPLPQPGQRCLVLYKGMLPNDTVFDASYLHGNQPLQFHLMQHQVIAGWDSVFSRLHCGDKARMTLAPQYAYGKRAMGKIPANATLIFEVELIDALGAPTPWDAKGKDTITTPSGLKVVMFESHPENPMPTTGSNVVVDYSGFLLNGTMFDSSVDRGQPYSFPLGRGRVIKGWDEGIAMLHKGEKAKLIIPPALGYGDRAMGPTLPANSTLVFDVHLIDFK